MQQSEGAGMHRVQQPYAIETFGMFRNMLLTGDFTPKVRLDAVMAKHPTTGVGAVADARGEITIFDGKLIVSYGKETARVDPASDAAALLAMGSAADWQNVTVDHDIAPADIESYLAEAARAHGVDPEKSFPFEVRGTLTSYVMHVNAEPTGGPHGMGLPMAIRVERKGERIDGQVAGLYVSPDLMGVATHGGERTHAHWVSSDGASTAHLDRWGLKSGATLMLPKP
jgi:alpha-acetolactate decarboxylase